MPRLREKKRLREQRLLGIKIGIPTYIPPELIERGFKLKFYDLSDVKIGEIGSDVKTGRISTVNFELMGLGCAAFSFVIDDMPKTFKYEIDLEDESLVGYWPFDEGSGIVAYDKSKYGNDGTLYPTPVPISPCDAVTDWTGTSLSIDTDDKKEGTGSLKDDVAIPVVNTDYNTRYNPAGSWDWSEKKHILFWLKNNRASTAFTYAFLYMYDTSGNWRRWSLTFSAGEWTAVKKLLSTGDAESGTPPDLALINFVQITFKTADTTPFYKKIDDLRIDDRPQWVDGKVGKCLDFDGVDDYVSVPDDDSLDFGTGDFSIAFWVKVPFPASDLWEGIITKGYTTAAPAHTWGICRHPTYLNRIYYQDATDAGGAWNANFGSGALSTGWRHICIKREGNKYYFYVDGVYRAEQTAVAVDLTNASNLVMGAWYNGTNCVGTSLDEVLIYKRALTASEIKALYELKVGKYIDAFDMAYRTRVDIHPYFDELPWFTGFIQTIPQTGQKKPFEYTGFGFFDQLDWVTVTGSYENQDVADIVKDIIENVVAPNTQIIYNASKVQSPSYTVVKIDFDHTLAKDAIQTLADMAQGYEFGVDGSREFYFRPIDTTIYHNYWIGKHFQDAEIEKNPFTVRNKLYIKIGEIQAGGSNIIGSVQDNDSISAHGLREDVINVPESLNPTDAQRWAADILARTKDPEVKAKIKNIFLDETKAKIEAKGKTKITAHDGTEYTFFIKRVAYIASPGGILAELELE